jgi:hypothetical protein
MAAPAAETSPAPEPSFSFDNLPASALDGYELDEQDVLNAIAQVDTRSVEQEAQVLETVEAIGLSSSDELIEDSPMELPAASQPASLHLAPPPAGAPGFFPSTEPAPPPSSNPVIKRGFY